MTKKKAALGRGLGALLSNPETDITTKYKPDNNTTTVGAVAAIPVKNIETNPFQPRRHFEEQALQELADSISIHGIIQPVTVRKMGYDKYQLISGERRFRASQLSGLTEIPAYIRIANDQSMLEMAIVENVQRENLDPIEVALSYQRLIEECSLTQEELSHKVGKKRATVTNYLRLLKLAPEIQLAIIQQKITMGHARALLGVDDMVRQMEICQLIIEKELSVRAVEEIVKNSKSENSKTAKPAATPSLSKEEKGIKSSLLSLLGNKANIKPANGGKGKIEISYSNPGELADIAAKLGIV
ncbi:MAG: ParB family chromosome partitioning protein [Sphingobacteriales bacterium]|jgi:ParB family chromosome partitioning protein